MYVDNDLESGNSSTIANIHFERLFTQQLNCLHNSLNRAHSIVMQVEGVAASLLFQELLHEYLEQLSKEKEKCMQLLTALHITPGFTRNDVIEGFALELKKLSHAVVENNLVRDAGYCLQLNKLIHYFISFYNGLKEMAHVLQMSSAAEMLEEGFYGESDAQLMLSCLVTRRINWLEQPLKNEHIYESPQ